MTCFNSQPPEGGCFRCCHFRPPWLVFQLTAARRRLLERLRRIGMIRMFQLTAARRRLLPPNNAPCRRALFQLTAARRRLQRGFSGYPITSRVSTHSRPKAAATVTSVTCAAWKKFQLTAARRRLRFKDGGKGRRAVFQLTAARRRLRVLSAAYNATSVVSTHSRPKAAARKKLPTSCCASFQLTAARRRLRL